MNRTLKKLTLLVGVVAASAAVSAQSPAPPNFPPSNWILGPCLKPGTTTSPYSNPFLIQADWNDLFGTTVGIAGTGNFDFLCFSPAVTVSNQGRIAFYTGSRGSAQDEVYPIGAPVNQYTDSWLYMTMGGWDATGGNWSYADTVEVTNNTSGTGGTGTTTRTPFGKNAIDTTYYGASDRYFVAESTNGDIRVILRVDILGDASRLSWQLTNTTTNTISIGLELGQWVRFFQGTKAFFGITSGPVTEADGSEVSPWVTAPGYRPLVIDTRFAVNPALSTNYPANNMANPINFGIDQKDAYGLSLPTMPDPSIPDQTPVDMVDVGKAGFLLGPVGGTSEPLPPFNSTPAPLLADTTFTGEAAYVERWLPQSVGANGVRNVVAYYRSTWSKSDYQAPYSAVLDAPNLVSLNTSDTNLYNTNPMIIRVYVDNTRGFSTVNQGVPLEDVQVSLQLPQGVVNANDGVSNTATQYIPIIPPTTHTLQGGFPVNTPMSFVDFPVVVDPGSLPPNSIPQQAQWATTPLPQAVSGQLSYSVTITPNPGPTKTLTGTINVATRPQLNINNSANLVGVPWTFGDNSWATIFAANTNPDTGLSQKQLTLNEDFQAYYWDPIQQTYVGATNAQRGLGYWLLMSPTALTNAAGNYLADRNLEAANPQEPTDIGTGGLLVDIQPGWNLISNPYDYAIPLGQLVGVPAANPTSAQTYPSLASQGLVSSSVAYWDNNDQNYQFTTSFSDLLQPNTGYWIFVSSPQKITISFPPVSAAFLPVPTVEVFLKHAQQSPASMPAAKWKLNLAVKSGKATDLHNYVGVVANPSQTQTALIMKPPVAPLANAVSAAVVQTSGSKTNLLAQSLVPDAPSITWNWQVYSRAGGSTTVTWPNMSSVPSNLDLQLLDKVTGATADMRASSSYTFTAKANSNHQFQIVVGAYTGPIISNLTATLGSSDVNISYSSIVADSTTIKVFKGAQLIDTVKNGAADAAGSHTVQWNEKNSAGQKVGVGTYTIQVTGTITGGRSDVKTTTILVH